MKFLPINVGVGVWLLASWLSWSTALATQFKNIMKNYLVIWFTLLFGSSVLAQGTLPAGMGSYSTFPAGAVYRGSDPLYGRPFYSNSISAGQTYYILQNANDVIYSDAVGGTDAVTGSGLFTPLFSTAYQSTATRTAGQSVTNLLFSPTYNYYGRFYGESPGYIRSTNGFATNLMTVFQIFNMTNTPAGLTNGLSFKTGGLIATGGPNAFLNVNPGQNFVITNDQYLILDVLSPTTAVIFPWGQHSYTNAPYTMYPNNWEANDINQRFAGSCGGDGSLLAYGNYGKYANSGVFVWANGTNSVVAREIFQGAYNDIMMEFQTAFNGGGAPFGFSTIAPYDSLRIFKNGVIGTKYGFTNFDNVPIPVGVAWDQLKGSIIRSNALSTWPTVAPQPGACYWGNSNGNVFLLTSGPGSTTWTKTNLIATP